ncbi:MAG: hypothetical protein WD850_03110 [Candidatus Spechtbacterales bacterium]
MMKGRSFFTELRLSEYILLSAGIVLLASLPFVLVYGDFTVWVVAKGLYLFGVLLFLLNR